MKANETESNGQSAVKKAVNGQSHVASFSKVLDGRKHPIRGLWIRGGRYYAQLRVETPGGVKKPKRVPLVDKDGVAVQSVAQAMVELRRIKTHQADNTLQIIGRTPKLRDYVVRYLEAISSGEGMKKLRTIAKEKSTLAQWVKFIGELRLDQIKRVHVNRFIERRLKAGRSKRTCNLDVVALRVVLKRAQDDGLLVRLPMEGMRPMKTVTPKRSLVTAQDIEALCQAALEASKNGEQFADYVRLMACCGARRDETLQLRWQDVDFNRGQLTIGATGDTKNSTSRVVDFNPKLRALLINMQGRRAPDTDWIFPSPQRGEKNVHVMTFRESLTLARSNAEMPSFGFHDCRHHFISQAVMSGIDFMTIAVWVGHRDGGVLIGKVYGHLADEHRRAMAEKINFEPVIVHQEKTA